jgi:hypothetical protein
MKLLAKLEKNKIFWSVFILCTIFFLLRLPSVIEPYWYGDEGVYEVIGQALNHGEILYSDIWDNKPPLLYVVYSLFQGNQQEVKMFSLIIGLLSVVTFFFLSQELFKKLKISILTTSFFVLLFATPILEGNIANAEDFLLLPVLLAAFIIYKYSEKQKNILPKYLFTAGILLGMAFLFKIVAIFDFAALLIFLITYFDYENRMKPEKKNRTLKYLSNFAIRISVFSYPLIAGLLIPFIITVIYFAANHGLSNFFQAVFFSNIDYVGYGNSLLGIPQGLLLLKIILLAAFLTFVMIKHKSVSQKTMFIILWLTFSLFNVYFSGRPYTHYAIVLIPSFCLFIGLLVYQRSLKNKATIFVTTIILVCILSQHFSFNATESIRYYQNTIQFISGNKSVEDYQSFFDPKVPRDYILAAFITSHTTKSDSIFIWGNTPQIYALSHKLPITKYTVAYHIMQNNAYDQTQQAINKIAPKYIIVLTESQPLPFVVPLYIMRYNIPGATIYERSI